MSLIPGIGSPDWMSWTISRNAFGCGAASGVGEGFCCWRGMAILEGDEGLVEDAEGGRLAR